MYNENRVEKFVYVLNDFEDYPIEEMKAKVAAGVQVELVYAIPTFSTMGAAALECFRLVANVRREAEAALMSVNAILKLPLSSLHILSSGGTYFLCKTVQRHNKDGGLLNALREKAGRASAVVLSKWSLMRFA